MHTASYLKNSYEHVVILLAHGFHEAVTVHCLDQLRAAGLSASLVGIRSGLVQGLHGLSVRPDHSLTQLSPGPCPQIVLIPGGPECVATLLVDPRVHLLVQGTIAGQGKIAVMAAAEAMLREMKLLTAENEPDFILQKELTAEAFALQLVLHLV